MKGWQPNKAKQFVACSYSGHVIGDNILFYLAENSFVMVGRAPSVNWVQFHAQTGGFNVKTTYDDRSPSRPERPTPLPASTTASRSRARRPSSSIDKLNGAPLPELKFFNMAEMNFKGRKVRTLRHGHGRRAGCGDLGPVRRARRIAAAIIEAGKEFGLVPVGSRAYATNTLESGWVPSPLPAVYTDERMKKYREWLLPTRTKLPAPSAVRSSRRTSRTTTSRLTKSATARS